MTVLFGTEYGCSEEVAEKLCDRLGGMGPTWQARLVNARYHTWIDWPQEQVVLVVISTSGDGELEIQEKHFFHVLVVFIADYCIVNIGFQIYTNNRLLDLGFQIYTNNRLLGFIHRMLLFII